MPRPPAVIPKVYLRLALPADLRMKLDMHLFSEVEGRVPLGKYAEFFAERLEEMLDWEILPLTPYGFPEGFFVKGPKEMVDRLRNKLEETA